MSRRGLGLVQVLGLLVAMAVVSVALVKFTMGIKKGAKNVQGIVGADSLQRELGLFLQDPLRCAAALGGKLVNPGSVTSLSTELKYSATDFLAQPGQVLDTGATISKIELRDVTVVTANSLYTANLSVEVARAREAAGASSVARKVALNLEVVPSGTSLKVNNCYLATPGLSPKDVCDTLGGIYNAPTCTLPGASTAAAACIALGGKYTATNSPPCKTDPVKKPGPYTPPTVTCNTNGGGPCAMSCQYGEYAIVQSCVPTTGAPAKPNPHGCQSTTSFSTQHVFCEGRLGNPSVVGGASITHCTGIAKCYKF